MTNRILLWAVSTLLYFVFVAWYTDFGGPLDDAEIASFMEQLALRGEIPEEASQRIEQFMREDSGRQFLMVNIIDLADNPPDIEGAQPGETAQQLMARYMAYMFPQLLRRACHPTVMGFAVADTMDLVGLENARVWDQGAMMRYRSRRSFMEIVANGDQAAAHHFKVAALDKTVAFPIETQIYLADLRLLLGLVLFSVTALLDLLLFRRVRQA